MITIPPRVANILQRLLDAGYEAFIVGGCVRDQVLGTPVADYDITTSATPTQIKEVFSSYKIMAFGEKHGTIGIYDRHQVYEITTYRTESEYSDGRRPDSVTFVSDLTLDLARRDFTINAMAADIEGHIHDPHGGLDDIEEGVIRAVGNPVERFTEDSLRILRAFRFSFRLSFVIDSLTAQAIRDTNHLLIQHQITGERIGVEMNEILSHGRIAIESMHALGTLQILFPFLQLSDMLAISSLLELFPPISDTTDPFNSNNIQSTDGHPPVDVTLALLCTPTYKELSGDKQNDFFSQLFEVVKGYGTYRQTKIQCLLDYGPMPEVILNTSGNAELLRWVDRALSYHAKKEFDLVTETHDLLVYAGALWQKDLQYLAPRIYDVFNQLRERLPVSGRDAQDLGYVNQQIRSVLDIWTYAALFLNYSERDQFISLIIQFQKSPVLDLAQLRSSISGEEPKYTKEENEYLIFLISSYLRLAPTVLIISDDDPLQSKYPHREASQYNLENFGYVTCSHDDVQQLVETLQF